MIDFDALVLAPAMATFARPITLTPVVSQPDAAAYPARGVWASTYVDVPMDDGSTLSSQNHKLGIRLADTNADGSAMFAAPPQQRDLVEIPAAGSLPRIGVCEIANTQLDGQGNMDLVLKVVGP